MILNVDLYTTGNKECDEHNARALIIIWNSAIESAIAKCLYPVDIEQIKKLKK